MQINILKMLPGNTLLTLLQTLLTVMIIGTEGMKISSGLSGKSWARRCGEWGRKEDTADNYGLKGPQSRF